MRVISAILNFYGATLLPLNFNSNKSYLHLKVEHARNFCHFDFFMVLSYCPLKLSNGRSYRFSRILTLTEVISFRILYMNMIKVQKSKLIKNQEIIRYDDR